MLKKYVFVVSLSLSVSSSVYADTLSTFEKNFNEQVMHVMQNIENKSVDHKNIDEYLNHIKVSHDVKQAVKSNIEHNIHYSDFRKASDGVYLCNKADQFHAQCNYYGNERGYQCAYTSQPIMCHTLPPHPGPDKSTCKP